MGSFQKLIITSLCFLLLLAFDLVAEPAIDLVSGHDQLPVPSKMVEVEYRAIGTSKDTDYFLLTNADYNAIILEPTKVNKKENGAEVSFTFPAPLYSLEYFLMIKQGSSITQQSETISMVRNCLPRVSIELDNQKAINKKEQASLLFAKAKSLEQNFTSFEQALNHLEQIKTLKGW